MARSHARILASIWSDPEWLALPGECQRMYLLLISQHTCTQAGVVALTLRRWASMSGDGQVHVIEAALKELNARRFLVVDEDTEEVLVRSFMRNDGVARQGNVMKAALHAARGVRSHSIRQVLAAELRRIDVTVLHTPKGHEPVLPLYDQTLRELDGSGNAPPPRRPPITPFEGPVEGFDEGFQEQLGNPSNVAPSEVLREDPRGRGGGRGGSSPLVTSNSALKNKHPRASRATRETDPEGFDEFWSAYPRKEGKRDAVKAYASALKRGVEPAQMLTAVRRYAAITEHSERRFIAHPATWLNKGRYDDEPVTPSTALATGTLGRPSGGTTSERVNAILALKRGTN